ncbi:hypothetical protein GCM10025791_24020 [Halioxenophilus aromaticivorans]|uniref:Uncharacterized protein n=1 Tax=Halioxenophilus aromaticivorans TaxID=1306992 RepID=A0AAV3U2R1_9ALTE
MIVDDGPAEKTVREMEFFVEGDTKEHLTKLAEEYPVVAKSNYVSATIDGAPQVAESGSKMYIPYKNAGKYVDYLLRKEFERDKLNCRSTHCSVVIGIEEQNGGSLIYVRATVMHNIGSFTEYVRGDLQERLDF